MNPGPLDRLLNYVVAAGARQPAACRDAEKQRSVSPLLAEALLLMAADFGLDEPVRREEVADINLTAADLASAQPYTISQLSALVGLGRSSIHRALQRRPLLGGSNA